MKTGGQFSRQDLARALGLGAALVAAALVVLAPVIRGENAYGSVHSLLARTMAGNAYFLLMLAFLGLVLFGRTLALKRLSVPEPAAPLLLAAYLLYVALRGPFSNHPYEAQQERLTWLANFLLFALLLLAAGGIPLRRCLIAAAAATLAVQSFQAIYQIYVTLPEMRRAILGGMAVPGIDMQNPAAVARVMAEEPYTTFLHANALAGWMASAALASAGLAAGYLAAGRRGGYRFRVSAVFSWLPLAALFAWAFYLTGSKGAYIAAAAAVAGALLAAPPAGGRAGKALRAAGAAALCLMLAGALACVFFPKIPGRSGLAASVQVRLGYWRPAARMTRENPAFGLGPGTFGAHYPRLKLPLAQESKSAHSAYLETAAEQGLTGLALLAAFWGWAAWRMLKRARSMPGEGTGFEGDERSDRLKRLGVTLLAGAFAAVFSAYFTLTAVTWWGMVVLGLVWAAGFALAAWPLALAEPRERDSRRLLDWALFAAAAAFLVHSAGSMGMSLRSLVGPALILAALALAGPGRREWVLTGRLLWPGAAGVLLLALAAGCLGAREWVRAEAYTRVEDLARPEPGLSRQERLERNRALRAALDCVLELDSLNWLLRIGAGGAANVGARLAGEESERGRCLEFAERHFREAVRLAPARGGPRRRLARHYLEWKRLGEAAECYEKLCPLYPLKAQNLIEWGDVELLLGRAEKAESLYRRALETSRRVGDEAIHLSILLENYNRLAWQRFGLKALAAALDALLERDEENAPLLYRRALVEVARGEFEPALGFMEHAAATEPEDAQLLLFEGYAHRLTGDWGKALDTIARAGRLEKRSGRSAGPGAVRRAVDKTELARELEEKRRAEKKGPPAR